MQYVDSLFKNLDHIPDILLYVILGVSAFVENIFPPIPGDTITALGAFLVGMGRLSFLGVYLVTTLGSLSGFLALFWIGRILGRRFFMERDYRFLRAKEIRRAEDWYQKYGYLLIAFNRFLPGIRSAISLAGGITRLGLGRVTLLALASAAAWNLIWILMGYTLGNNWEAVRTSISGIMLRYNVTIFVLLGCIILLLFIRRWRRTKK
jgi:membrane protein DedA with SNARE-associated domain